MIVVTKEKLTQAFKDYEAKQSKLADGWRRGVIDYVFDFLDFLDECLEYDKVDRMEFDPVKGGSFLKYLRNGAESWSQYSWGGCSLIYDCDIAERVCTPLGLERKKGGELQPSHKEQWLDVQARALAHASKELWRYAHKKWEEK